jgi:outer membrane protein assembly factor BamB
MRATRLIMVLFALTAAVGPGVLAADPASDGLPALPDVPFYRADALRSSLQPGPGPIGEPVVAWERTLDADGIAFPILVDGILITGTQSGLVIGLDGLTGEERWRAAGNQQFSSIAPSAADGIVVVTDLDGVSGLDVATGVERWHREIANDEQRPAIMDGVVYVGTIDGAVHGLDVTTGEDRWSWQGERGVSTRVDLVANGVAYVSPWNGQLLSISLDDGRELWRFSTRAPIVAPTMAGGTLYVQTGQADSVEPVGLVAALDPATGAARWRFVPPSGFQATVGAFRDDILYVNTQRDGVFALRDGGSGFSEVWHNETVPMSDLPAQLSGDILYVAMRSGGIMALRAQDGSILWQTPTPGDGIRGPIVSGGMLYWTQDIPATVHAYAEPSVVASLPGATTAAVSPEVASPAAGDPLVTLRTFPEAVTGIATGDRANGPEGVQMDVGPDGLLYVIDLNALVSVIDPATGQSLRSWGRPGSGEGEFQGPHDIAVAEDGRVYIADAGNHRVQVFTPEGTFVDQIGSFGESEGQFSMPTGVAVAPDGSSYIKDGTFGTVSKFGPDGAFEWRVGGERAPDTRFRGANYDIAVMQDGRVLSTVDPGGPALLLDPRDGSIVGTWGEGLGASAEPWVDPSTGNVWIFQYVPGATKVFDAGGRLIHSLTYTDGVSDQLWLYPAPVITPDGHAWSLDHRLGLVEMEVSLPEQ